MEKRKSCTVGDNKYFATKRVRLDDILYQEYWNADVRKVDVMYINEATGEPATDDIYLALVKKFCITRTDDKVFNG